MPVYVFNRGSLTGEEIRVEAADIHKAASKALKAEICHMEKLHPSGETYRCYERASQGSGADWSHVGNLFLRNVFGEE